MPTLTAVENRRRVARLEGQALRIRNRLASAWDRGCSMEVVHRLECGLRKRWQMLEQARQLLH